MKKLLLALALALPLSAVSTLASAAGPTCAKQAAGLKGAEKKDFIAQCKKEQKAKKPAKPAKPPKATKANKMAQCNADFKASGAAPTDRPNFMKECLKHK